MHCLYAFKQPVAVGKVVAPLDLSQDFFAETLGDPQFFLVQLDRVLANGETGVRDLLGRGRAKTKDGAIWSLSPAR